MKKSYFKGLSRKDYILKAQEIMRNEGLDAVTLRRMASEMSCSTTILYRYFSNLEELHYYAALTVLDSYIKKLSELEASSDDPWVIYNGVWDVYSKEAFAHPQAYDMLFLRNDFKNLRQALNEYYETFPEDLEEVGPLFKSMLKTTNFEARDFEVAKKCVAAGVITYDNAVKLNRMVCMLFKGYFKTFCETEESERDIGKTSAQFLKDENELVELFRLK